MTDVAHASTVAEEKLLRGQAQVLRQRIAAQRDQLDGALAENRALGQEVDLYADAVEQLIKQNRALRQENDLLTQQKNEASARVAVLEAKVAAFEAQLIAERKA